MYNEARSSGPASTTCGLQIIFHIRSLKFKKAQYGNDKVVPKYDLVKDKTGFFNGLKINKRSGIHCSRGHVSWQGQWLHSYLALNQTPEQRTDLSLLARTMT